MNKQTIIVTIAFILFCAYFVIIHMLDKIKRKRLMEKYNDPIIVNKLMKQIFWQGETAEQLHDSLGAPIEVNHIVLKTKNKEVWKYDKTGKNRFGLKITLENDIVIGWDQK